MTSARAVGSGNGRNEGLGQRARYGKTAQSDVVLHADALQDTQVTSCAFMSNPYL